MLYLGVDSGGTKTRAVAMDGKGRPVFQRLYPSLYLPALGEEATRATLEAMLADLPQFPDGVVLGLGGYGEAASWDEAYQRVARGVFGPRVRLALLNDGELAWWGAFEGKPGVVVVAGTGSLAYGKGPGGWGRAGGFGPLFGDEGSAYWIGLEALRRASWAADGRTSHTLLVHLPQVYGKGGLLELLAFLQAEPQFLRTRVAALAQEVDRMAAEDVQARVLLTRAGRELGLLARSLSQRLGVRQVAPVGGVFRSAHVSGAFRRYLEAYGLEVVTPRRQPAEAAAWLAYKWGTEEVKG